MSRSEKTQLHSTQSLAAISSATLINSSPCNTLDFDNEVLTMEAEQFQESYDFLLEKYEKLKYENKTLSKSY